MPGEDRDWAADMPDFDLVTVPEIPYNHELISEKALWPIVDTYWGGNFRRDGEPNMPGLTISKAGFYEDQWYEVVIEANTDADEFTDEESDTLVKLLVHTITISMEQLRPAETGSMLDLAITDNSEPVNEYLQGTEGEPSEHSLRAMAGMRYCFDSDGDYIVKPFLALRTNDRQVLWGKGLYDEQSEFADVEPEAEAPARDDDYIEPKFSDEDVSQLLIAAHILGAPPEVLEYLDKIKAYPEYQ